MVSIKGERPQRRAAWFSLAVATAAAFITLLVWWVWPREAREEARQRSITDVTMTWQCRGGHRFAASGHVGSEPCPECGAPADVVLTYRCPEHGEFALFARYQEDANGATVLREVRLEQETWHAVGGGVRCPACGGPVSTVREADRILFETKGR